MFERFTRSARAAVVWAEEAGRRLLTDLDPVLVAHGVLLGAEMAARTWSA